MEFIAAQDLGYRIVLDFADPAVEIPVGTHLADVGPVSDAHNTHVMRVADGPAEGAVIHFICARPFPDEEPYPDRVCPAPWLRPTNGEVRLAAPQARPAVKPLLADAEAPLAVEWNADAPPDARGHWLTGSFVAGLVRSGDIDGRLHRSYYPNANMVAAWHDEGLAMVVLCDAERSSAGQREIGIEALTAIFASREDAESFKARLGGWPDDEILVEQDDEGLWLVTAAWRD